MSKKRQVIDNDEKFVSFVVRLPSGLKRKLVEFSDRSGQSQASIITNLVADHIPDRGASLPKVLFTEHESADNQVDLENWLAQHGKG